MSKAFHKLSQVPSNPRNGAGVLFTCTEDNSALFLLRSDEVSEPGTWGVPGGSMEQGEQPFDTARRETLEELGSVPRGAEYIDHLVNENNNLEYHIFVYNISLDEKKEWSNTILLNHEHIEYRWFKQNKIPNNLFSGLAILKY